MYQYIFLAIKRLDLTNQIHKIRIHAASEKQARIQLARDYVLVLTGKINPKNHPILNRTSQQTAGGNYAQI